MHSDLPIAYKAVGLSPGMAHYFHKELTPFYQVLTSGSLASGSEFKVNYCYSTKFFYDIISLVGCNSD